MSQLAYTLIFLGTLTLPAWSVAEHAENKSIRRPLFNEADFTAAKQKLKDLSKRCEEIKLGQYPDFEALTVAFGKTGLPAPDRETKTFFTEFGIFDPYTLSVLGREAKTPAWLSKTLPRGLDPDRETLADIDAAVARFSWMVMGGDKLQEGTTFFIGKNGHALTNLHVIRKAIVDDPTLSTDDRAYIEKHGVTPDRFPHGISVNLSSFRSGSLSPGPARQNVDVKEKLKILLTPPFPLAEGDWTKNLPNILLADWALLKFSRDEKDPRNFQTLPLVRKKVDQDFVKKGSLFTVGYTLDLGLFPGGRSGGNSGANPWMMLCWHDEKLNSPAELEKKGFAKFPKNVVLFSMGSCGPGMSGSPLVCNENSEVCGLICSMLPTTKSLKRPDGSDKEYQMYEHTIDPPPYLMRVAPIDTYIDTVAKYPALEQAITGDPDRKRE